MIQVDAMKRIGENFFDLAPDSPSVWLTIGNLAIEITPSDASATIEVYPLGQGTDPSLRMGRMEISMQDAQDIIDRANAQLTMMENIDPLYVVQEAIYSGIPICLDKEDPHFSDKHALVKTAKYWWDKASQTWFPPLAA